MFQQGNIEKLHAIFEKVDRTYSIFFGFLVFCMGCLIIISEVQTIDRSTILKGDTVLFDAIKDNDMVFADISYSF